MQGSTPIKNATPRSSTSTRNTFNGTINRSFGQGGCRGIVDGRKCGETTNLQIIQEFNRLYETKMQQIDDAAGGDCVQAKLNLQQEWIRDLTDQNQMLVRVVEELEVEAAERVTMLEEKLEDSAKNACEVMEGYRAFSINFLPDFQKLGYVQSDLNNLVEVLRRIKQHRLLCWEDLTFHTINMNNLMDEVLIQKNIGKHMDCKCNWSGDKSTDCKVSRTVRIYFEVVDDSASRKKCFEDNFEMGMLNEKLKKMKFRYYTTGR